MAILELEVHELVKEIYEKNLEFVLFQISSRWERSGSVVECLTGGRGAAGSSLTCVVSLSKNINPTLVLVQPRKIHPYITERLLMGRKESNQTNKTIN